MNRIARFEFYLGTYKSFNQTIKDIERVTTSEILEFVNITMDRDKLALAVLGPANKSDINKIL